MRSSREPGVPPVWSRLRQFALLTAVRLMLVLFSCSFARAAMACPFCGTTTGQQVAGGIFDTNFWLNVALVLAPFPFLLGIVAIIHGGLAEQRPVGEGELPDLEH